MHSFIKYDSLEGYRRRSISPSRDYSLAREQHGPPPQPTAHTRASKGERRRGPTAGETLSPSSRRPFLNHIPEHPRQQHLLTSRVPAISFFIHDPTLPISLSLPTNTDTMADNVESLIELPKEFIKDGVQFMNKCQKRTSIRGPNCSKQR